MRNLGNVPNNIAKPVASVPMINKFRPRLNADIVGELKRRYGKNFNPVANIPLIDEETEIKFGLMEYPIKKLLTTNHPTVVIIPAIPNSKPRFHRNNNITMPNPIITNPSSVRKKTEMLPITPASNKPSLLGLSK